MSISEKVSTRRLCKFFVEGNCNKLNCRFLHIENYCKHYYNGNCKFGEKCNKSHMFSVVRGRDRDRDWEANKDKGGASANKNRRKKNTISFKPDYSPPSIRLVVVNDNINSNNTLADNHIVKFGDERCSGLTHNDVLVLPNYFEDAICRDTYNKLLEEIKNCGYSGEKLWKLWHGDNHLIADDKLGGGDWKIKCPTFGNIIDNVVRYFDVDVKATRINWYKDRKDWKPYHRDAAAIDKKKSMTQNITIAMTFGSTRSASFLKFNDGGTGLASETPARIDIPLTNGSIYVFNKQVNIDWMHGIIPGSGLQSDSQEGRISDEGRISIIVWGWSKLLEERE